MVSLFGHLQSKERKDCYVSNEVLMMQRSIILCNISVVCCFAKLTTPLTNSRQSWLYNCSQLRGGKPELSTDEQFFSPTSGTFHTINFICCNCMLSQWVEFGLVWYEFSTSSISISVYK